MSSANYHVKHHVIPAQHIRELPNALAIDEAAGQATLQLSVNQYVPKNNVEPRAGDITIIAFHAVGQNKELYEPLWDDLLTTLPTGVRIRGIWMADMAQQGNSYILNQDILAEGICWDDHSRDILHLVNIFRDQMPQPLIGVGHSMGGSHLLQLCHMHPRLFSSVAFLDPWFSMQTKAQHPMSLVKRTLARDQKFDTLDIARRELRASLPFKLWDQRCFDRYIETALHSKPALQASGRPRIVPTTPLFATFHSTRRVHAEPISLDAENATREDRLAYPDVVYDFPTRWPYCMPHAIEKANYLPTLRPRALFLYASLDSVIPPKYQEQNTQTTGLGSGGSGGQRLGCVSRGTIKGTHFFPFDNPAATGERLALWLTEETVALREEKAFLDKRFGLGKHVTERQTFPLSFEDLEKRWQRLSASKL